MINRALYIYTLLFLLHTAAVFALAIRDLQLMSFKWV